MIPAWLRFLMDSGAFWLFALLAVGLPVAMLATAL
jgi:hypothetical protein